MSPSRKTFKDHQWARQYRRVYGNRPLPHESRHKVALLARLQRKGLLTKFQFRYFLPHQQGGSVPVYIHPGLALAMQKHYGCEFACDLVIEISNQRSFYLTTRGYYGAAISDALCFYLCSPYFAVLPGFHTHERLGNALGCLKPSVADFFAIGCQQIGMGSHLLRLAVNPSPPKEDSRRLSNSRWWSHRWRRNNDNGESDSGYPYLHRPGLEEDLRMRSRCLKSLKSKVYFPNAESVYYALRWPGRGFVRQQTGRCWQPAW